VHLDNRGTSSVVWRRPAGNFVTGDTRILKARPEAVFDQRIAVASTASLQLHPHLVGTWFGNVAFDEFPAAFIFVRISAPVYYVSFPASTLNQFDLVIAPFTLVRGRS
jgi:hypothetical protein